MVESMPSSIDYLPSFLFGWLLCQHISKSTETFEEKKKLLMNSKVRLTTYKRNAQTTDLQAYFPHRIWCKQTLNIFLLHSLSTAIRRSLFMVTRWRHLLFDAFVLRKNLYPLAQSVSPLNFLKFSLVLGVLIIIIEFSATPQLWITYWCSNTLHL